MTEAVASKRGARIESVDVVRGAIMIIRALDHVRDYFSNPGFEPTDLAHTSVALFFTRWITHFCAPVFFLLTGTGAYLSLRKQSPAQLSRFLFARGLWLIFLELVVVRFLGWQFNFDYRLTLLIVLWALGWSMYCSIGACFYAGVVGYGFRGGVNRGSQLARRHPILKSNLVNPTFPQHPMEHSVFVLYPLIPWVGVTAAGYGLGQIYKWQPERRQAFLLRLGLGLTAAFVVIRAMNIYGDPFRWSAQKTTVFTTLSFLNTTKYPPSLLYLLMALGPAMLFLRALDATVPRWLRPALIVGKVPMFYYLLHIPLMHIIAVVVCYARYGQAHWMFESPSIEYFPITRPPGWNYSLPVVYLVWVIVVVTLYPLCKWFAALKQWRNDAWLSYL